MRAMEIEKAIEEISYFMHSDAYCDAPSNEACEMALAALREKQEREMGCEFCTGDVNTRTNILDGDCGAVYIDMAGRLTAGDDGAKIRFCPMCSRPFVDENRL